MTMAGVSRAFTLIEVLISIALISLVLIGLNKSLSVQRRSNKNLHAYLERALERDRGVTTLYRDLLSSDGNISIRKGEFDRLCIRNTVHSLYGLSNVKVCWLVLKGEKVLVRVEGGDFHLPLAEDDRVAVDRVMGPMELFDLYRKKGRVLAVLKTKEGNSSALMLYGLDPPKPLPKNGKGGGKRAMLPDKQGGEEEE